MLTAALGVVIEEYASLVGTKYKAIQIPRLKGLCQTESCIFGDSEATLSRFELYWITRCYLSTLSIPDCPFGIHRKEDETLP